MKRGPRAIALDALVRIDAGAYANLALPGLLTRSNLDDRDRAFVTELVYGTTRMRRACDWLVDRFLYRDLDPEVRAVLRLGAYQLAFLQTPPHAAVGETVDLAEGRTKGLVNAVLRKVAAAGPPSPGDWPDDATRLSYPDWILERLTRDLGSEQAVAALEQMNEAATVTERLDGYIQDEASQQVAALVDATAGERVVDLCAAPGGKATLIAQRDVALVAAGDVQRSRARLVADNAARLDQGAVVAFVGDGRCPPLRPGAFDHVLVDAPCSGLGVLRRRPDARWRIQPSDVEDLVRLQRELLTAAIDLIRPDGTLIYSVCTLTAEESEHVDRWLSVTHPSLVALPAPGAPWEPVGRGARLLPHAAGTDGMYVLKLRLHPR
ncbi:MAG TPA: transcription antitermination factor NusB [Acidimicrobiales bacterium]|nr:transcription antitermination factor NusB [Acidimicrobiales bacterium]